MGRAVAVGVRLPEAAASRVTVISRLFFMSNGWHVFFFSHAKRLARYIYHASHGNGPKVVMLFPWNVHLEPQLFTGITPTQFVMCLAPVRISFSCVD